VNSPGATYTLADASLVGTLLPFRHR
jgi:hypothetical protein